MNSINRPGRFAGLLYLLVSVPGVFALIYVPSKLIVSGNATATASNIAASDGLFRLGIAAQLASQILFMWVTLALYDLFKGVHPRRASIMLALIVISIPIALLNELNAVAALLLVEGPDFLLTLEKAQRDSLAMLFLKLHSHGFAIAEIFWGLWLLPLGLLVYRSRFYPRVLGVLLVLHCFYYLITSFMHFLAPQATPLVARWLTPFKFGELFFMFWLLIRGGPREPAAAPSV
jgi:hypothetical protein